MSNNMETKAEVDQFEVTRTVDTKSSQVLDKDEERRITKAILWKLDTRMLPMLALLFLFSFLDR